MKWEYMTQYLNPQDPLRETLNRYGANGWELVTIANTGGNSFLVFKRSHAAGDQSPKEKP